MELLDVVPRAYTIITKGSGDAEELVSLSQAKFSGKNAADEDPENESYKNTSTITTRSLSGLGLVIFRSVHRRRQMGFALCRLFIDDEIMYLTFGSKNYHITIPLHHLRDWLDDEKNYIFENAIVYSIAQIFMSIATRL